MHQVSVRSGDITKRMVADFRLQVYRWSVLSELGLVAYPQVFRYDEDTYILIRREQKGHG